MTTASTLDTYSHTKFESYYLMHDDIFMKELKIIYLVLVKDKEDACKGDRPGSNRERLC